MKTMSKKEFAAKVAKRSGTKGIPFWLTIEIMLASNGIVKDEANSMIVMAREWVKLPLEARFNLRERCESIVTKRVLPPNTAKVMELGDVLEHFINSVW
jgi:hypothetical protein